MKRVSIFCAVQLLMFFAVCVVGQAQTIATFAGNGTAGYYGDGAYSVFSQLNNPAGMALDASGNLYFCDMSNQRVRKISTTGIITTIAGNGTAGYGGDDSAATLARLYNPMGVALDASGNIYIADGGSHVIRKITISTGIITTYAGQGTSAGFSGDGGAATSAQLNFPTDVVVDRARNLYIADRDNYCIRKVDSNGTITTVAGTPTYPGYSGDGASAGSALLSSPAGVALDSSGNLYISELGNDVVRKVDRATGIISTFAGSGLPGYTGDCGDATAAKLYDPGDIVLDGAGNLYIADQLNNVIRKVSTSGIITTFAGSGTAGYSGDGGAATAGTLNAPIGISVDPAGSHFYISDKGNNVIRYIEVSAPSPTLTIYSVRDTTTTAEGICNIDTLRLACATTGGVWASSDSTVAAVSSSGLVRRASSTGGTVNITYTATNSCGTRAFGVFPVRVIERPVAGVITGVTTLCEGATVTMRASTVSEGGAWYCADTRIATVLGFSHSDTCNLRGVSAGTTTITYNVMGVCGTDYTTTTITVQPSTRSCTVTGAAVLCRGSNTNFNATIAGGVWTSSNAAIASVGATTGAVYGLSAGSATITYTVAGACDTAVVTRSITIDTAATAITISGATSVCRSSNANLSASISGGSWSSSNTAVASVNAATGFVYGISLGSATISYTLVNSCGTYAATRNITIDTAVSAGTISGADTVCLGATTTLSASGAAGGTWSSSDPARATVNTSGVVTGVSRYGYIYDYSVITYTVANACGSSAATRTVWVSERPRMYIYGEYSVCVGATTSLSASDYPGGTWSSSEPSSATVNASGVVTGVGIGGTVAVISYDVTNACGSAHAYQTMSVNPVLSARTVGSPYGHTFCVGSAYDIHSLGDYGGTWSSNPTSVATVGVGARGVGLCSVYGVSYGSATITYTVANSCGADTSTFSIFIDTLPSAGVVSGPSNICVGSNAVFYASSETSGSWASSAPGIASCAFSGSRFSGVSGGTATISYSVANACGTNVATTTLTVTPIPVAGTITGGASVCVGATDTLSSTGTAGGRWSSSATAIATVNAAGIVTGIRAGTATITYLVTTDSCGTSMTTRSISVIGPPNAGYITGASPLCIALSDTLADTVAGGTWSCSNHSVASVNPSTGVVTGIAGGDVTITYSVTAACGTGIATASVTIIPLPVAGTISGYDLHSICVGNSVSAYSTGDYDGTWSSSAPSVVTVNSSGDIYGVAAGSATVTYSVTNGCGSASDTELVTVYSSPNAGTISGTLSVCELASTRLTTSGSSGGIWSSSAVGTATVGTTGVVTGITAGAASIYYTVTNVCGDAVASASVTVNPAPNAGTIATTAITSDSATFPAGTVATFTSGVAGGVWSNVSPTRATINTATGVVTSFAAGGDTVRYTVTNGCGSATSRFPIVYSLSAGTISGPSSVCVGNTITLTSTVIGGTWTSSMSARASVTSTTGVVRGVSGGAVTITYSVSTARAYYTVTTVASGVGAITGGTSTICPGSTMRLASATTGGTWTNAQASRSTVASTGDVTAIAPGADTIYYTVVNACGTAIARKYFTVTGPTLPAAIGGGTSAICPGATRTNTEATTGGVWSLARTGIATISTTTGTSVAITGIAAGTDTLKYTLTNGCGLSGTVTSLVTVNALPYAAPIAGPSSVAVGSNITLTDSVAGGVWSHTAPAVASLSTTGVVYGLNAGVDTIKYKVTNTCGTAAVVHPITVAAVVLSAGTISGPSSVCVGSTISLTSTVTSGTWTSSMSAIATVDATTGAVVGVNAGNVTITCSSSSARAVYAVTVNNPGAAAITGGSNTVCPGGTMALGNPTPGGTWSSSVARLTTVSATGNVTALASGADTIRYTVVNACGSFDARKYITVTAPTVPLAIGGSSAAICPGATRANTNGTTGGVWSLAGAGIATLSTTTGTSVTVTGLASGVDTLKYTLTNTCGMRGVRTSVVTVNPVPNAGTISGPTSVLVGGTINLTNTVASGTGTWSNAFTTISSISTAGVVRGRAAGLDTIRFRVTNGCGTATARYMVTVLAAKGVADNSVAEAAQLHVYPNPSNGIITIAANEAITHIFVTDLTGKLVTEVAGNDTKMEVDLSAYAAGSYLLRIATASGVQMVKVLKE